MGKEIFFNRGAKIGYSYRKKKMNLDPYPIPNTKINSKWTADLKVNGKIIDLLINIEEYHHDNESTQRYF